MEFENYELGIKIRSVGFEWWIFWFFCFGVYGMGSSEFLGFVGVGGMDFESCELDIICWVG